MKLSNNFTLHELTKSQIATRMGISNDPTAEHYDNLVALAANILQPISDAYKKPVIVSSGYRSVPLNARLKGSITSQHCFGEAADFEIVGIDNYELALFISMNLDFDQLILEFYVPGIPNSGWVHCSFKRTPMDVLRENMGTLNRKSILTARSGKEGTVYLPGFYLD